MAELHGDLFSCHASSLGTFVFVVVDERGQPVMSDEICRQCNGQQQGRGPGGRSAQLPDSLMIQHYSSRHSCMYTYILIVRTNAFSEKKKKPCSSDLGMNMYLCAKFQGVSLRQKRREHQVLVLKTRVLYVVACDHLVLV